MADEHLMDSNCCDTFVCELSRVERFGPVRRLVFTVPDVAYPGHKMIVARLIVSADKMADIGLAIVNEGVTLTDALHTFEPRGEAN